MNSPRLISFLHLVKHSGHLKLGAVYVRESNAPRIKLIVSSEDISHLNREHLERMASLHNIPHLDVPANILLQVYPGKSVKVICITSADIAKKIANLRKEGENL